MFYLGLHSCCTKKEKLPLYDHSSDKNQKSFQFKNGFFAAAASILKERGHLWIFEDLSLRKIYCHPNGCLTERGSSPPPPPCSLLLNWLKYFDSYLFFTTFSAAFILQLFIGWAWFSTRCKFVILGFKHIFKYLQRITPQRISL